MGGCSGGGSDVAGFRGLASGRARANNGGAKTQRRSWEIPSVSIKQSPMRLKSCRMDKLLERKDMLLLLKIASPGRKPFKSL